MSILIHFWVIGSWAAVCAIYDLLQRRIPNFLTLGAHFIAIAILVISGQSWLGASIISCVIAWGVALLLTVPAYSMKLLGAGDVKMLAAIGLFTGTENLLISYIIASVVMAGMAIFYKLAEYLKMKSNKKGDSDKVVANRKRRVLPFGFGFSVGLISVLVFMHSKVLV